MDTDEISSIKTFFQYQNVHVSTAWLEGCISWCKEENFRTNYTLEDLQRKVFEQWLLLDLRDVEVPSLPPNLSSKIKYILNGNYSLQVMKVIDISKPKHWQLQRIRNSVSKNTDDETESSKRVLQLTLSDGIQEVEAMEYQTIPHLNLNMSPGIKIRLMGPITVRRGRLLLESKNVTVLGGEVEELIVPNAAENVLAAILKLPLNPTPKVIEESLMTANKDIFNNETGGNRTATQSQNTVRSTITNAPSTISNNIRINQQATMANKQNVTNALLIQDDVDMMDISEEDESRIAAEIDMLLEAERDVTGPPTKKHKTKCKTPDMFDDVDIDDSVFENIVIPSEDIKVPVNSKKSPVQNQIKSQIVSVANEGLEFQNEFFEDFDIDAHLDKIDSHLEELTKESRWKPSTQPKPAVLTIQKLLKNIPNISNGKFKIKAKFISVAEKLTLADDNYHLVVNVQDETADLTVKIHSDVVSDFIGCCPASLFSLKTGVQENNPEAEKMILEALNRLREKLIQLDTIVEVQVNAKEKFPVIVNVIR